MYAIAVASAISGSYARMNSSFLRILDVCVISVFGVSCKRKESVKGLTICKVDQGELLVGRRFFDSLEPDLRNALGMSPEKVTSVWLFRAIWFAKRLRGRGNAKTR